MKQDVLTVHYDALHCTEVDWSRCTEEAEKDVQSYASSFGQSVIYAIMHCTMQPLLSGHNPLFLQLCMASWDFSPLPISAPHPTTSKQSASNCITLEIPSNFVHLPEHTMPIGAQHSRLHNPHVLSHINVDTSKCILAAC